MLLQATGLQAPRCHPARTRAARPTAAKKSQDTVKQPDKTPKADDRDDEDKDRQPKPRTGS
jgi:hypothetical protein